MHSEPRVTQIIAVLGKLFPQPLTSQASCSACLLSVVPAHSAPILSCLNPQPLLLLQHLNGSRCLLQKLFAGCKVSGLCWEVTLIQTPGLCGVAELDAICVWSRVECSFGITEADRAESNAITNPTLGST